MATPAHSTPTPARTGRRALFGAAAALAVAPAMARTAPHPDAELIAIGREASGLIAQYNRHTRAFFALPIGHPDLAATAALADPMGLRLDDLIERASGLTATTAAGCATKALLLRHELLQNCGGGGEWVSGGVDDALAWSLVNDLLAGRA